MNKYQQLYEALDELDLFLHGFPVVGKNSEGLRDWESRLRSFRDFESEPALSSLVRHAGIAIRRIRTATTQGERNLAIWGVQSIIDIGMAHLRSAPHNCGEVEA